MDIPNSKSPETLFAHNLFFSSQVILKFYTEHGSATAVLCVKFRNDLITEMSVMDLWAFRLSQVLDDILYCNNQQAPAQSERKQGH